MTDLEKEISILKEKLDQSMTQLAIQRRKAERLANAAFSVLEYPNSPETFYSLKQSLVSLGFCLSCHSQPCQCGAEDQDD